MKPSNVLIQELSSGRVCMKVSDFGLSKVLDADRSTFTQSKGAAGTRGWMAPEVLKPVDNKNPVSQSNYTHHIPNE